MNDSEHKFLQNYKISKQVDLSYLSFFELSCTYSMTQKIWSWERLADKIQPEFKVHSLHVM